MKNTKLKRINITTALLICILIICASIMFINVSKIAYADGNILDYLYEAVDGVKIDSEGETTVLSLTKDVESTIQFKNAIGNVELNMNGHDIQAGISFANFGLYENTNLIINGANSNIYGLEGSNAIENTTSKTVTVKIVESSVYGGVAATTNGGFAISGDIIVILDKSIVRGGESTLHNGGDAINVSQNVTTNGGLIVGGQGYIGGNAIVTTSNLKSTNTNIAGGVGKFGNGGNAIEAKDVDIDGGNINVNAALSQSSNGNGGFGVKASGNVVIKNAEVNGGAGQGSGNGGDAIIVAGTLSIEQTKVIGGKSGSTGKGGNGITASSTVDINLSIVQGGYGSIGGFGCNAVGAVSIEGGSITGGNSLGASNDGGDAINSQDKVTVNHAQITGGNGGNGANGGAGVCTTGDAEVIGYSDELTVQGGNGGTSGNGGIAIQCVNLLIEDFKVVGGNGGKGVSDETLDGTKGGDGALAISVTTIDATNVSLIGGNGGEGGSSKIGNGGNGGNGAEASSIAISIDTVSTKGGNGGKGGNTENNNSTVGNGGLGATGGEDGVRGYTKAEQIEVYLSTFRFFLQFAKYEGIDSNSEAIITETYEALKAWLYFDAKDVKENCDLIDNYVNTQYGLIYNATIDAEKEKFNSLKDVSPINVTSQVSSFLESVDEIPFADAEGYRTFKNVYLDCESVLLSLKKEIIDDYINYLFDEINDLREASSINELRNALVFGKLNVVDYDYNEEITFEENCEALEDMYNKTASFKQTAEGIITQFENHVNTGKFTGEWLSLANDAYKDFKSELEKIDPVLEYTKIDTLKDKYQLKLDAIIQTRIKSGEIDLQDLSKVTGYGTYNGSNLWGYIENVKGLDKTSTLVIGTLNTDKSKDVKKLINKKSYQVAKDNLLEGKLKNYLKNKVVKNVVNISLFENGAIVEQDNWNNGLYKVSILLTDDLKNAEGIQVVDLNGGVINVYSTSINGNYLEFYTTHFSEYIILANKEVNLTWLAIVFGVLIVLEVVALVLIYMKKSKQYTLGKTLSIVPGVLSAVGISYLPLASMILSVVFGVIAFALGVVLVLVLLNIIDLNYIFFSKAVEKYKEEEFSYEVWVVETKEEVTQENEPNKKQRHKKKKNKK